MNSRVAGQVFCLAVSQVILSVCLLFFTWQGDLHCQLKLKTRTSLFDFTQNHKI